IQHLKDRFDSRETQKASWWSRYAGGMHHHRINFDKYHPGYFGKVRKFFQFKSYSTDALSTELIYVTSNDLGLSIDLVTVIDLAIDEFG
ncbi:hypothetical protein L9F63_026910, partial [Diploptera punctata]